METDSSLSHFPTTQLLSSPFSSSFSSLSTESYSLPPLSPEEQEKIRDNVYHSVLLSKMKEAIQAPRKNYIHSSSSPSLPSPSLAASGILSSIVTHHTQNSYFTSDASSLSNSYLSLAPMDLSSTFTT